MRAHAVLWFAAIAGLALPQARAQTSANYKLTDAAFNNGGHPTQGSVLTATHFRIKLDAIGGGAAQLGLQSASFRADAGFVSGYAPSGEVAGLKFSNKTTLQWSPERSIGAYEVYREALGSLAGSTGACFAAGLTAETATDAAAPAPTAGYFYLVTARNRLREEGTKGFRSGGAERVNTSPCP